MRGTSHRPLHTRLSPHRLASDDHVTPDTLTSDRVRGRDPQVARLQLRLRPQTQQHSRHHAQELGVERAVEDEVAGVVDGHQHRDDQLEGAVAVRAELGGVAAVDQGGGRLPTGQVGGELSDQKQHDDTDQGRGQTGLLLGGDIAGTGQHSGQHTVQVSTAISTAVNTWYRSAQRSTQGGYRSAQVSTAVNTRYRSAQVSTAVNTRYISAQRSAQ